MKECFFDKHTHTLEHGINKPLRIEETIQGAIDRGVSAICLTDHYPLPPGFQDPTKEKDCAMPESWYPDYQRQIDSAIEKYGGKIKILRGAEFDWLPNYKAWTEKEIISCPFDYVIGSVHFVGEIADKSGKRNFVIDYTEEEFRRGIASYGGIKPLVCAYYARVRRMIRFSLFDAIGHIDLIKKYNDGTYFREDSPWYRKEVLNTLETLSSSGMALEINTSGLDKKCQAVYPSEWILKEAKRRNIEVTTGSDGHTPETIGKNLDKAVSLAKSVGYTLAQFINRTRKEFDL